MTLSLSSGGRAAALDGIEVLMLVGAGTANLTLYQTNTSLCVFPLTAAPFGAAAGGSAAIASCPISSTGTEVAGTANRFILTNEDAATVLSGTIGGIGSGADIETEALTVTAAATQTLNSFVLRMAANGVLSVEASLRLV